MTHARAWSTFAAATACFAFALVALAQSPAKTDRAADDSPQVSAERLLAALDSNDDGKIDSEEAAGHPRLSRGFGRLDADGSGALEGKEIDNLVALIGRMTGRQQRALFGGNPGAAQRRPARGNPRQQTPEGVERTADIEYRTGNAAWKLDLYVPTSETSEPRPAIVFVHGGGWRSGDKGGGMWRSLPQQYAADGYVCISINYRLTDQAQFPACIEDVKCAVRCLRANAKKWNVDPERIGAFGNSAGAHLVSLLALSASEDALEGDGPHGEHSSAVQAVCAVATPADFTSWPGASAGGPVARLLGGATPEEAKAAARRASPVTYASADAPPFLVIHGDADRTVPVGQGDRLVEALKEAGAKDVTYLRLEGAGHGVFQQRNDQTAPALQKFFARTLKGQKADP